MNRSVIFYRPTVAVWLLWLVATQVSPAADSRFAHSDSDARFLHRIDLYDADNRKITPESDRPYSSAKTCGRCHDYETISHGWHFNAFDPKSNAGRPGEPWIWTEPRTGTQLPLSYRSWNHVYDPREVGITPYEMTRQFGGRIPGGGPGDPARLKSSPAEEPSSDVAPESEDESQETSAEEPDDELPYDRWPLSGPLEIDCMVCHAASGAYDFNLRRDQIAAENFAWAPTAALHLGTIDGTVARIKDGADVEADETKEKLPTVTYDASRFDSEGAVFMDLIREPESNACYQCHSNRTVSDSGIDPRWVHDDDVHLRAGMVCADCHRNGIDHHIVRGFAGEENPSGTAVETLSCAGCHLGGDPGIAGDDDAGMSAVISNRAGRLGAPKPLHAGLPPLHFEKLSCTACHGGPVPRQEAVKIMTSLAHGLGSKDHRTGQELPAIAGPVYSAGPDGRVAPHRVMWPAFWGVVENGKVRPLPPEEVYDVTRRALRVRKDLVVELLQPKLKSGDLKELLGEDRQKVDAGEYTEEEAAKVAERQAALGRETFDEKISAALEAIEEHAEAEQAVYVSSGVVYARGDEPETLKTLSMDDEPATGMVRWPLAHNVRPSGWSLGAAGCVECHSDDGMIFASTVAPIGPGPEAGPPQTMASLQGVPANQRLAWNELFKGRTSFKWIVGGSLTILMMAMLIGIGAMASRSAGKSAS